MIKIFPIVIGSLYLLADKIYLNGNDTFTILVICTIAIGFIWYPEFLGKGNGGMVVKRGVLNESPAFLVKLSGWLLLISPILLLFFMSTMCASKAFTIFPTKLDFSCFVGK